MKVSFLTTYRYCDQHRFSNLERVVNYISVEFPGWEIVVVEQDEESTLASHPLVQKIKYLHVYNPGPFNKSWGMNVAFKQSSGDILVVSDADMIMQADDLQRAINACEKALDAVRPYGRLIDMTESETEEYMQHAYLPDMPEVTRGYDRGHAFETLCMAGGIYVLTREFFARTGGMDERFSGWGGEDDAMSIKLQSMSARVAIARNAMGWHLWHPRESRYDHDGYLSNRKLLQQYRQMDKTEIALLGRQQFDAIGNTDKYRDGKQQASMAEAQSISQGEISDIIQLFPENYGEVTLTGPKGFGRKFGIVIPSCGRSEYLEQCLASLAKSDLSRAVICIVDETEARKVDVEGFTCFEGIDYPEMDIKQVEHDIDSILFAISQESSCNLFNEQGWLKQEIKFPSRLEIMHPRHGLYVRNTYLDENPAIGDLLNELRSKEGTDTADVVRKFSITNIPVIKVFKDLHRNMFDSLRVGWDCLEVMGCKYLVNLDADAIVDENWLARLKSIHEIYKKENPGSPLIVTGFNSASHEVLHRANGYVLKKSAGGINMFFNQSIYQEMVRPTLRNVYWDHALSEKIVREKGAIVATVPSVVQHVGDFGLWARPWNFDVADDFIG